MEHGYIIMGGSFNPPTLAHQRLLTAAVEKMGAEKGVFLPSSHSYVLKKMRKAGQEDATISEEVRFSMLEALAKEDERLTADDYEFHCPKDSQTFESLLAIQEKHPEATVCLLLGSDKLKPLPRWHRVEELLSRFQVVIVQREGENAEERVRKDPTLSPFIESFHFMETPAGTEGVSSTVVREMMEKGDPSIDKMCHGEVLRLWREYLERKQGAVKQFREEYFFLSNFYETEIDYGGLRYSSSEAAFQAQKCLGEEERMQFTALSPSKAKSLGRKVSLRSDWQEVKVGLMEDIVRAKFQQHSDLAVKLLATGDRLLEEGNSWNDTFWGISLKTGAGKNILGKILMKIREELREQ